MATQAIPSYGTLFSYSSDGGSTYIPFAEITSLSGPTLSAKTKNVSTFTSASGYAEKIGTMKDAGSISMDVNFIPASGQNFISNFLGQTKNYRVTWPDVSATKWSFAGILTKYDPKAGNPESDALSASLDIELTGYITFS